MPPSIATPLSSGTARDLYGVRALPPAGVVPFGYTGHAEDPTGLTWGRARCYAPRTGGWTGEDPVFTEPRYAYVGGRPSVSTDPSGANATMEYVIFALSGCAVGGAAASWGQQVWGSGGPGVKTYAIGCLGGIAVTAVTPGAQLGELAVVLMTMFAAGMSL